MRGQDLRRSETHPRPFVMGILNVTPDSFSDGGRYTDADAAVEHAFRMIDEGAEIIDIGAESTRPGFTPVPAEEEIARLIPVIERLRQSSDVIISADTMKTETARAAISAGADIINDVNALRWPGMLDLLRNR
jgi:dihydropteroate synthase